MQRCQAEMNERMSDKKIDESALAPLAVAEKLSFDELLLREGAAWRTMLDADSLRCTAARVSRLLKAPDYERFLLWLVMERGLGLMRSAGLFPMGPRIGFAS